MRDTGSFHFPEPMYISRGAQREINMGKGQWKQIATCISAALSNYNVSCNVYHLLVLLSATADHPLCACTTAYIISSTFDCLQGLKKNLSVSDFLPTLPNYMLLNSFFRGFGKNSTKTYVF